jgi:hypothetical protein
MWHEASGTALPFAEWCDPTARRLTATLAERAAPASPPSGAGAADDTGGNDGTDHTDRIGAAEQADGGSERPAAAAKTATAAKTEVEVEVERQRHVDAAVVAFAQARAGADHTAEAVAADMVAVLALVDAQTGGASPRDPVGLVARALAAWATEQVAAVSTASCIDPVTGLVNGGYLRARLRELHAQCKALSISPSIAFGALVLRLDFDLVPPTYRLSARVGVGRTIMNFFRSGETVAALSSCLVAAVMPAYALERAESDVQIVLSQQAELAEVQVTIDRQLFGDDATDTWSSLVGTRVGA